MVIQL